MKRKRFQQNINATRIDVGGDYAGRDLTKNDNPSTIVRWFVVGTVAIVLIVGLAWGTKLFEFSAFGGSVTGGNVESPE